MSKNRYRVREYQKRHYTVTTTKAVVGFILSVIFSLILSPAFEKFGLYFFYMFKDSYSQTANDATANMPPAQPSAKERLAAVKESLQDSLRK